MWALLLVEAMVDHAALSGGLVLWEYAINDSFRCGGGLAELRQLQCVLEAFLVRLAQLPSPPAVVFVFLWSCGTRIVAHVP